MKTALLLSGNLRYYEKTFDKLKKYLLDVLDTDIFIHTWYNRGLQKRNSGYKLDLSEIIDINHVNDLYEPKRIVVETFNENIKKSLGCNKYRQQHTVPIENILSMYRKIELCDKLRLEYEIDNDFKYDLVIRCRPDIVFESPIPSCEINDINNTVWVPNTKNKQINDHLAFSNGHNMKYYCSLYSKIDSYYDDEAPNPPEVTDKGCCVHAETLLNYHLRKSILSIQETKTSYFIPHKKSDKIDKYQSI